MQNPHFKHRAKRVGPLRNGTLPKQSSTQYVGAGRGKAQVPSPVKGINKHKSEHGPLKKHKSEKAKGKEEEGKTNFIFTIRKTDVNGSTFITQNFKNLLISPY